MRTLVKYKNDIGEKRKKMFKLRGHGGRETFDLLKPAPLHLNTEQSVTGQSTHIISSEIQQLLSCPPDADLEVLFFTFFPCLCACKRLFSALYVRCRFSHFLAPTHGAAARMLQIKQIMYTPS